MSPAAPRRGGYVFDTRPDPGDRILISDVYRQAIREDWTFRRVSQMLRDYGVSYRRADMQYDYRRYMAIERANTIAGRQRAERWFDYLFEPIRAALGVSSKRATEIIAGYRQGRPDDEALVQRYFPNQEVDEMISWYRGA